MLQCVVVIYHGPHGKHREARRLTLKAIVFCHVESAILLDINDLLKLSARRHFSRRRRC